MLTVTTSIFVQHHLITVLTISLRCLSALPSTGISSSCTFRDIRSAVPAGKEQRHLADVSATAERLWHSVQSIWIGCRGPISQTAEWLQKAHITVTRPVPLSLNHVGWTQVCEEMLEWGEGIVLAHDRLTDLETESREATEALYGQWLLKHHLHIASGQNSSL